MVKLGVYTLTNKLTGTLYIGSTTDLRRRLIQHRSLLVDGIHNAKDLLSSFRLCDIYQLNFIPCATIEIARDLELRMITMMNGYPKLANVLHSGKPMPQSTRDLIRNNRTSTKGVPKSDETRANMSRARIGFKMSQAAKDKVSRANTGRKHVRSQEYRDKIRKSLYKPVSVNGVVYSSMTEASNALKVTPPVMTSRVKSNDPRYVDWIYL